MQEKYAWLTIKELRTTNLLSPSANCIFILFQNISEKGGENHS